MWEFLPKQASAIAGEVDAIYLFIWGVTLFFTIAISAAVAFFAIKYRRGNRVSRENPLSESKALEAIWIGVPFIIVMVIFFWSTDVYFKTQRSPTQAREVWVTGKQWMWKFQHASGQREINELHLPVGQPVRLIMTSQDVIHDVFVPAMRVKQDVLPSRYTYLWFNPTEAGTYHLFCAEYCGTQHSGMIGRVVVMEPSDFEQWLAGGNANEPLAVAGERIFQQQGCATCHMTDNNARAPQLAGLFGKQVPLRDGGSAIADEAYLRESILQPTAKMVVGYDPLMPTFQGRISDDDVVKLIAYIKSLGGSNAGLPAGETQVAPAGSGNTDQQGVPESDARGSTSRPSLR